MNCVHTDRLILRPWRETDRPIFHRLSSDPDVMRFFPYRWGRAESDLVMDLWNENAERTGLLFAAIDLADGGSTVGMAGLGLLGGDRFPFPPTVQIGWRLLPEHAGRGYATEAGAAWLQHAFTMLDLPEIVSDCSVGNVASEAVMIRLGMRADSEFDHPSIDPATHPQLVRHKLYRLRRDEWMARDAQSWRAASPS